MLIFLIKTIHIFIPVRGCVGRSPNALLCPGAIMLLRCPCMQGCNIVHENTTTDILVAEDKFQIFLQG